MANEYNPIAWVGNSSSLVKCPSSFQWTLEDVSAPDAGRTEDVVMHKKRIGQVVALQLSWQNITTAEVSAILKAFNPEYIDVNYLDPMQGGYITKTFYVGNRSTPLYNAVLGLWSNVSFNIIEQDGAFETV